MTTMHSRNTPATPASDPAVRAQRAVPLPIAAPPTVHAMPPTARFRGDAVLGTERADGTPLHGASNGGRDVVRRPWSAALIFTAALACVAPTAAAQPSPSVRLHLLADSVSLGERFEVAVAVDHPAGHSVLFPAPPPGLPEAAPALAFGDAEVLDMRRLAPTARGTARTDSAVYTLAVFETEAVLGPISVQLTTPGDTTRLESGVADLAVRSEIVGEASPQPAPPEPVLPFPSVWWIWALVALIAAGLAAVLVPWLRRRFGRQYDDTVRLPAYAEARGRLEALAGAPLTDVRAPERIVLLSDILRTFLGRRLDVPALEITTAELDAALDGDDRTPEPARKAVRGALRVADLVKFADATPDAEVAREVEQRVRDAVDQIEGAARTAEAAAIARSKAEDDAPPPDTPPDGTPMADATAASAQTEYAPQTET